jgi:REP element-mobilizing transposase RayT
MHVVLRSTRARGPWSLRRKEADHRIRSTMRALAQRYDLKVYEFANAGNHIHMLVRARKRDLFQAFLRAFAGIIARQVTGARRGRPIGRFWDDLAYSRILHWGREFSLVGDYVVQNELEARGLIPYVPRRWKAARSRSEPHLLE